VAAWAQSAPLTKVSLIADNSTVTPGSNVWVGIHFQLEPGWHIYWANPGDAGEPPKVQWQLPPGWAAGTIDWPAPERLTNAAGVDYGYDGEATLLTRVQVPANAKPGSADVNANLRWLICKEMCVPQKGPANLKLNVGSKAVPDAKAEPVIASTRARLPKPIPADWKLNVLTNPRQFLLNFRPGTKVDSADFFPLEPQVIENTAPQKLSSTSMRAQLALQKDSGAARTQALKGVLVLNGTDAYAINIPIIKK
jgi:thiol:disulfide interchange protein DsbD